jgi:hypothetical protein
MSVAAAPITGQAGVEVSLKGRTSSGQPGEEGFRSGWQTLLAALNADNEPSSGSEAQKANNGQGTVGGTREIETGVVSAGMQSAGGKHATFNVRTGHAGLGDANGGGAHRLKADARAGREIAETLEPGATSSKDPDARSDKMSGSAKSLGAGKTAAEENAAQASSSVSSQAVALAAIMAAGALNVPSTNTKLSGITRDNADELGELGTNSLEGGGRGTKVALFEGSESLAGAHLSQTATHGQPSLDQSAQASAMNGKLQPEASEDNSFAGTGLNEADGVKSQAAMELPAALNAKFTTSRKETGSELPVPDATITTNPVREGLESPAMAESRVSQNNASSSMAGKHGIANGGRSAGTSLIASTRSMVAGAPTQHGTGVIPMQPPAGSEENSGWALGRDMSSTRGTAGTPGDGASERGIAAAGSANRDTFSALDTESASRTSTWIHAGTHNAEAGYQDASLGWVGVRADLGAGGIHASLVPATADAARALGGHLAGLNAHLAERHTPVETLTLTAPENQGADAGTNSGANQNLRQGSHEGQQSGGRSETPAIQPVVPAAVPSSSGGATDGLPMSGPAGTHISVIA